MQLSMFIGVNQEYTVKAIGFLITLSLKSVVILLICFPLIPFVRNTELKCLDCLEISEFQMEFMPN